MNRIDRYIATTVGAAFAVALIGLLSVFSVINLTEELRDVGVGQYTLPVALWFVVMTLPAEAYELFAAASLVGATAGLAMLSTNNELVAMFAAGISPQRVIRSVLKTAAILSLTAAALGEFVAAPLAEQAMATRSVALSSGQSLSTARGVWAREGSRYINIRRSNSGEQLVDLYFFDFDEQHRLTRVTHADQADYADLAWKLTRVSEDLISDESIVRKNMPSGPWETMLTPERLQLRMLPPEQLSMVELRRTMDSMRQRGESPQHHLLAFWQRATMPLIAAIMVFLAVPVVLSMPPRVPLGYSIALAALLGIGFQMLSQTFNSFGLVYGLNAAVSATLPAACALAAGLWRLRASL